MLEKGGKKKTFKQKSSQRQSNNDGGATSMKDWDADEVIMSKADFEIVKKEYLKAENE